MLSASVFLIHRAFVLIFPYRTLPKREAPLSSSAILEPDAVICSKRIDAIKDQGQLEKQFDHWLAFLREEDERRKSIDARLTSIIGLSSVAATVVFGTLVALASGSVRLNEPILQGFIAALAAFLTIQLGLAIRAAIQGLGMRTYLSIDIPHMIQTSAETNGNYLKRRFKWSVEELIDHSNHNDEKILWMNVALAALRNFIISLMVMALCMSLYIGTTSEPPEDAPQEVWVRNGAANNSFSNQMPPERFAPLPA